LFVFFAVFLRKKEKITRPVKGQQAPLFSKMDSLKQATYKRGHNFAKVLGRLTYS
jgi:hypothetical protein